MSPPPSSAGAPARSRTPGFDPAAPFARRVAALPHLSVGISTEFGAGETGLDILAFRAARPDLVRFLEIGADVDRGLDAPTQAWCDAGLPTTWHFLDANLEEPEALDIAWTRELAAAARAAGAAWLCGDAGLWHIGPRDRAHGVLMPPILDAESAADMAVAVRQLRLATGLEVLPENPPAHVYLGPLHLLDYFARVADGADSGLLLDVAHLAVYQRVTGRQPTDGLDGFPLDRVVEIHIAGGTPFVHEGRTFIDDDHGTEPLPEVAEILRMALPRMTNLRAIVLECERNPRAAVEPWFERAAALWHGMAATR